MTKRILLCLITVSIFGCGKSVTQTESSSLQSESSLFAKSFEQNLIAAGMSAEDAAFLAEQGVAQAKSSEVVQSGKVQQSAKDEGALKENLATEIMRGAIRALSDNRFLNDAARSAAYLKIYRAHFEVLEKYISKDQLPKVIEQVARAAAAESDRAGMSVEKLVESLKRTGEMMAGFAANRDRHDDYGKKLAGAFVSGVGRGVSENNYLAASAGNLFDAVVSGAKEEAQKTPDSNLAGHISDLVEQIKREHPALNELGSPVFSVGKPCKGSISPASGSGSTTSSSLNGGATSQNYCLSYCANLANNNPTRVTSCSYDNVLLKVFQPSSTVVSSSTTCVARVSVPGASGLTDYRPPQAVNTEGCLDFCSNLSPAYGDGVCMKSNSTVIGNIAGGLASYPFPPPPPAAPVVPEPSSPSSGPVVTETFPACRYPMVSEVPSTVWKSKPKAKEPTVIFGPGNPNGPVLHIIEHGGYVSWAAGLAPNPKNPNREMQYAVMMDTTIHIAPGTQPIFLALKNSQPIRYKITGAVERVVKLYSVGPYCNAVSGLDTRKVDIGTTYQNKKTSMSWKASPLDWVYDDMKNLNGISGNTFFYDALTSFVPELANIPLGTRQTSAYSMTHGGVYEIPGDMTLGDGLDLVTRQALNPPPAPVDATMTPITCNMTYMDKPPVELPPFHELSVPPRVKTGAGRNEPVALYTVQQFQSDRSQYGVYIQGVHGSIVSVGVYTTWGKMTVNIEPGDQKIYLVIESHMPTNIQIVGDVSRIVKVYVSGYHCQRVAGVSPDKLVLESYMAKNATSVLKDLNFAISGYGGLDEQFVSLVQTNVPELADIPFAMSQYSHTSDTHGNVFEIPNPR